MNWKKYINGPNIEIKKKNLKERIINSKFEKMQKNTFQKFRKPSMGSRGFSSEGIWTEKKREIKEVEP